MWHELVLNGVGGRTVEEARLRMDYAEFLDWVAFRRKRGSLHTGMRIEQGSALIAMLLANIHSKNGGYKLTDFMAHMEEPPLSLEDAMEKWD